MQGIRLLAASVDGGNVSSDGCHTPVVRDFLLGGGLVVQNLLRLRAEPNQKIHTEAKRRSRSGAVECNLWECPYAPYCLSLCLISEASASGTGSVEVILTPAPGPRSPWLSARLHSLLSTCPTFRDVQKNFNSLG